jgi:hypothetical protein
VKDSSQPPKMTYRRLRKLSDIPHVVEDDIQIVSIKTKGNIVVLDEEDEVQIVSITKPVVIDVNPSVSTIKEEDDAYESPVEEGYDSYDDLHDFIDHDTDDEDGDVAMQDVSKDAMEVYLGDDLDRLIEKLRKGNTITNLYSRDAFLSKIRTKYLEWAWLCGRESGIPTLTLNMLRDEVCKADDETKIIPAVRYLPKGCRAKCYACRMTRVLTRTLEGFVEETCFLGGDCAEKLQCVFAFVTALRNLKNFQPHAREQVLSSLRMFENVREEVWKKYK